MGTRSTLAVACFTVITIFLALKAYGSQTATLRIRIRGYATPPGVRSDGAPGALSSWERSRGMYEHILLAVALQHGDTPSPHTLAARDVAVALAQGLGARLSVLTVYRYPDFFLLSEQSLEAQGRYRQSQIQQTDTQLQAKMTGLFADLGWQDVPITVHFLAGRPGPLIVAVAEELGVDLIVIGTHRKRHMLDALLGGTASYVSRHALCPVLLARPSTLQWFLSD